jgi:hypothetical protein
MQQKTTWFSQQLTAESPKTPLIAETQRRQAGTILSANAEYAYYIGFCLQFQRSSKRGRLLNLELESQIKNSYTK